MADRIKSFQQETNQINILKSIRTDLGATASSYTPDTDVVTKDRVVTYAQAEEELSVLGDIEEGVKQQVTDLDIAQKDIKNIKLLLQGNLYDYQTDSTSAYTKTVPAGAMPYASLEQIGGKTLVWNQVLRLASGTSTKYDVTMVFDVDGTITLSGTATETVDVVKVIQSYTYILGHVYWLRGCPQGSSSATFFINTNNGRSDAGGLVFTANNSTTTTLHFVVNNGVNVDGVVIKVQLTDLTLVFGAGNEPTLEECRTMFPAESYPYNAGTLLSAGVTEVVSKKADTTEIATYPIPAEIRNLEGYGWSAGSVYNYVDFERKVFVKNVGSRAYASGDESDSTFITDGTTTYYPLTTAVETDISEYLTGDNLIQVEAGGTLTFPNSNGTDYQIPVPSAETYMINLQEAVSNG